MINPHKVEKNTHFIHTSSPDATAASMDKLARVGRILNSVYRFVRGGQDKIDEEILALVAERAARRRTAIKEREKSIIKAKNRGSCFITINVSGQRFMVDKEIFSRFPGKLQFFNDYHVFSLHFISFFTGSFSRSLKIVKLFH